MFTGRAPRAEYWWYRLGVGITGLCIGFVDVLVLHGPIYGNYGVLGIALLTATALPSIGLLIRRLHDIDRTGWWALGSLPMYGLMIAGRSPFEAGTVLKTLPTGVNIAVALSWIISSLAILIFVLTPGTEGANRYGPDPYGPDALEEVFA